MEFEEPPTPPKEQIQILGHRLGFQTVWNRMQFQISARIYRPAFPWKQAQNARIQ